VSRASLVLFALGVLPLTGCPRYECVDRGTSTDYAGSTSYVGQFVDGTGAVTSELAGTTDGTLVMDDFDPFDAPDCDEDNIEFTVRFGSCVLIADEASQTHDTGKGATGAFIGATAQIVQSLGCTLQLAEGPAVVAVHSGTLQVGPTSAQLTLAGTISSLNAAPVDGQIQWQFTGQ
jgi:hypothetical protein